MHIMKIHRPIDTLHNHHSKIKVTYMQTDSVSDSHVYIYTYRFFTNKFTWPNNAFALLCSNIKFQPTL